MNSTAREHSVDHPVVMDIIVMMSGAVFLGAVPSRGFGCCSIDTGAALSPAVVSPRADKPRRKDATVPSMPWAGMSLDSSVHSSVRVRSQLVPYGRGQPLSGLPHFEHPGTCRKGKNNMGSMFL